MGISLIVVGPAGVGEGVGDGVAGEEAVAITVGGLTVAKGVELGRTICAMTSASISVTVDTEVGSEAERDSEAEVAGRSKIALGDSVAENARTA